MLSVRCTISTTFFEWQVSDIKQFLLALIYICVYSVFSSYLLTYEISNNLSQQQSKATTMQLKATSEL